MNRGPRYTGHARASLEQFFRLCLSPHFLFLNLNFWYARSLTQNKKNWKRIFYKKLKIDVFRAFYRLLVVFFLFVFESATSHSIRPITLIFGKLARCDLERVDVFWKFSLITCGKYKDKEGKNVPKNVNFQNVWFFSPTFFSCVVRNV